MGGGNGARCVHSIVPMPYFASPDAHPLQVAAVCFILEMPTCVCPC